MIEGWEKMEQDSHILQIGQESRSSVIQKNTKEMLVEQSLKV